MAYNKKAVLEANTEAIRVVLRLEKERREATEAEKNIRALEDSSVSSTDVTNPRTSDTGLLQSKTYLLPRNNSSNSFIEKR